MFAPGEPFGPPLAHSLFCGFTASLTSPKARALRHSSDTLGVKILDFQTSTSGRASEPSL